MASVLSKLFGAKKTANVAYTLRVDGLFWDCQVNSAEQKVDVLKKEKMGQITLDVLTTDTDPDIVWKATQQITAQILPKYIEQNGLHQFIPFKKPSFAREGDVLEVCYYHDKNWHDKKIGSLSKDYEMQNQAPTLNAQLKDLCRFYNLNVADYI